MHFIDLLIFAFYLLAMLGVGIYFYRKNKEAEEYYLGGRSINKWHLGLSVVATDVGGGFSIGLGGLGFTMGISGSWMLFTGLIGAWLSAVFLIPRVKQLSTDQKFFTLPQLFGYHYNKKVALAAGLISGIGYLGFTAAQLLSGTKLASAAFPEFDTRHILIIMGVIAVGYTVLGGLKAVIYTDTVQWLILIFGLVGIGLPLAYSAVGGFSAVREVVAPEFLSLRNVKWVDLLNWAVIIIPIWFVGMTLYQRIYAAKDEKSAKHAWYFAGLLEWPLMAFMGTALGLLGRVAFEQGFFTELGFAAGSDMDPEMGLPLLLREVLPIGLLGLMLSAYFSAILSTADSCLMASSGNFTTDILGKYIGKNYKKNLRISQLITLFLGTAAIAIAWKLTNVLSLMLNSYAFMVSGLLIPIIAIISGRPGKPLAALMCMLSGGTATALLNVFYADSLPYGLDANIFGIAISLIVFLTVNRFHHEHRYPKQKEFTA